MCMEKHVRVTKNVLMANRALHMEACALVGGSRRCQKEVHQERHLCGETGSLLPAGLIQIERPALIGSLCALVEDHRVVCTYRYLLIQLTLM